MAFTFSDIIKWKLATKADVALAGGMGSDVPAALGTAAAGSSPSPSRQDHVHQMPTAAQVNALGLPLAWNASTNTPALTSSVAPVGNNSYKVTVAGSTTLNGINSWAVDDLLYFDGSVWQKIPVTSGGVVHLTSYAATSPFTGVTTESAALKTITLGVLPAGSRVRIRFAFTGQATGDTTSARVKIAGTTVCLLINSTFNTFNVATVDMICTSPSSQVTVAYLNAVNGGTPTNLSSNASSTSINTSSSVDLTITLQNSTTVRSTVLSALDVEIFQP